MKNTESFDRVIARLRLLTGKKAIEKSGIPSDFAHILLDHHKALGGHPFALRTSSSPPKSRSDRSPKRGDTHTKSTEIGLERGCVAKDPRFLRVRRDNLENIRVYYHDQRDVEKLECDDPFDLYNYQHTKQLQIVYQDLISEVGQNGAYDVITYDNINNLLYLKYKPGIGPITKKEVADQLSLLNIKITEDQIDYKDYSAKKSIIENQKTFDGYIVLSFNNLIETSTVFYRECDKPEKDKKWCSESKIIKKPDELQCLPDEIYKNLPNKLISVYTQELDTENTESELKSLDVFVNIPSNFKAIVQALDINFKEVFNDGTDSKFRLEIKSKINELLNDKYKTGANLGQKLQAIGVTDAHLKKLYDITGLFITSDWDALFLGYPFKSNLLAGNIYNNKYNTFSVSPRNLQVKSNDIALVEFYSNAKLLIQGLIKSAKSTPDNQSNIYKLLRKMATLDIEREVLDPSTIYSSGSITLYEYVCQQLINFSFRASFHNIAQKEHTDSIGLDLKKFNLILQKAFESCFKVYKPMEQKANVGIERKNILKSLGVQEVILYTEERLTGMTDLEAQEQKTRKELRKVIESTIDIEINKEFDGDLGKLKKVKSKALWERARRHVEEEFWMLVVSGDISGIYDHNFINSDEIPVLPQLGCDSRSRNLIQHGLDFQNPGGVSEAGGWFLVYKNILVYGEGFDSLIQVILSEGFLENYYIEVNPAVSFESFPSGVSWGDVVAKQLHLQFINEYRPKLSENVVLSYQQERVKKIESENNDSILYVGEGKYRILTDDAFDVLCEVLTCCHYYSKSFTIEISDKNISNLELAMDLPFSPNLFELFLNTIIAKLEKYYDELTGIHGYAISMLPTTTFISLVYLISLSHFIMKNNRKSDYIKNIKLAYEKLFKLIIDNDCYNNDDMVVKVNSILNKEYLRRKNGYNIHQKTYDYGLLNRKISSTSTRASSLDSGDDSSPFFAMHGSGNSNRNSLSSFSFGKSEHGPLIDSRHTSFAGVRLKRESSSSEYNSSANAAPPVKGSPILSPDYSTQSSLVCINSNSKIDPYDSDSRICVNRTKSVTGSLDISPGYGSRSFFSTNSSRESSFTIISSAAKQESYCKQLRPPVLGSPMILPLLSSYTQLYNGKPSREGYVSTNGNLALPAIPLVHRQKPRGC